MKQACALSGEDLPGPLLPWGEGTVAVLGPAEAPETWAPRLGGGAFLSLESSSHGGKARGPCPGRPRPVLTHLWFSFPEALRCVLVWGSRVGLASPTAEPALTSPFYVPGPSRGGSGCAVQFSSS